MERFIFNAGGIMNLFKNKNIFDIARATMIYTLLITTVLIIISFFKAITFETACIPMLSIGAILAITFLYQWFKESHGFKRKVGVL